MVMVPHTGSCGCLQRMEKGQEQENCKQVIDRLSSQGERALPTAAHLCLLAKRGRPVEVRETREGEVRQMSVIENVTTHGFLFHSGSSPTNKRTAVA